MEILILNNLDNVLLISLQKWSCFWKESSFTYLKSLYIMLLSLNISKLLLEKFGKAQFCTKIQLCEAKI